MSDVIQEQCVVAFRYQLTHDGAVLDDNSDRAPMLHLQGAGNIVKGLERAMLGHKTGDSFEVTLEPEDAYGERRGEAMPVPRSALPEDAELEPGGQLMTHTRDGRPMMLFITKVEGDEVWVDPHHPLAGKTLTWSIRILGVRRASSEEIEVGHPQFGVDDA